MTRLICTLTPFMLLYMIRFRINNLKLTTIIGQVLKYNILDLTIGTSSIAERPYNVKLFRESLFSKLMNLGYNGCYESKIYIARKVYTRVFGNSQHPV